MNSFAKTTRNIQILCVMAALSGCAQQQQMPQTLTVTKDIYVQWPWPPSLISCADDPSPLAIPKIVASDPHAASQVAAYIARLRAHDAAAVSAADDCRDTLAAAVSANKQSQ